MRTDTTAYQGAISNIFLPGTILLANIDMTGLFEYALKAAAGGAIWLGFKLAADYIEQRKKRLSEKARINRIRMRKSKRPTNGIGE